MKSQDFISFHEMKIQWNELKMKNEIKSNIKDEMKWNIKKWSELKQNFMS